MKFNRIIRPLVIYLAAEKVEVEGEIMKFIKPRGKSRDRSG
jgi:hypothetical protein